jgi:hypothetical protein
MKVEFNPAALIADVCAALGSDFFVVNSQEIGNPSDKYGCTTFTVRSPSVLGVALLFMRVEGFTGVVEASVTWPQDHNRRQVSTSTYISQEKADSLEGWPKTIGANIATRGPAAIAKDIQNRLIPKIVPLEPLVKAGLAAEFNRETDARLNHALILKMLGYSPEFVEQRCNREGVKPQFPLQASTKQGANHSAEFKVNDFGTTSVTLHGLSVDKVQAIIKALNLKG